MRYERVWSKRRWLLVLLVGAMPGAPAVAQEAAPPSEDVPVESCATAQCHAAVKAFEVVHGPVNTDTCDACHTLTDAEAHEFELAEDETELCASCHELDLDDAEVVHEPAASGNCLGCHHPHGGPDRFALRGATPAETCLECHDDPTEDMATVHGPVAAGSCTACHRPHAGEHDGLLTAEGRELCVSCHVEVSAALEDMEFPHEAMEGDCSDCHDPHASDHVAQVIAPPAELCLDCHDDIADLVSEAKHKHSVVTTGDACVHCHSPHGGERAKLLKDDPVNFCLACHDKAIPREKGHPIASMADLRDAKKPKHTPVRTGDCAGCHNVHGSDLAGLLTKPHPPASYAPFKVEHYALCFSCHDAQLALARRTDKATGFRDGDLNLHFAHVTKRKGRACSMCHTTHASDFTVQIKRAIPFGNWTLPLNYQKTATGGSCTPGCHQALAYDRDKPANVKPDASPKAGAPLPAQGAAPTDTTPPAPVDKARPQ